MEMDGNDVRRWQWMVMEIAMEELMAMDDNGDGWQRWTEMAIDSNGNGNGQANGDG